MNLREWFIALSEMTDGGLTEDASLEDGLEWFTNLPDEDLAALQKVGQEKRNVRDFLDLGAELMRQND